MMDIEMASNQTDSGRSEPFIIEDWIVDPAANQLRRLNTQEQRSLEPRLMHLLCLLASAPGTVLTRDFLINRIWPKVIVNENSLTRAVSELRKKLEFDGESTSLIDTIPKTGYRLSADCTVRDYIAPQAQHAATHSEAPQRSTPAEAALGVWQSHAGQWWSNPRKLAMGIFGAVLVILVSLQGYAFNPLSTGSGVSAPLADINLSDSDALSTLIGGRYEQVASKGNLPLSSADLAHTSNQPVISRDGRLFAMIRYSDEGSSLLLGSTDLPNSPITVLSTQDTLYNLQWSPIDRALLFAQAPRITPAALLPDQHANLVMFDIDNFTAKVIQGPALDADQAEQGKSDHGFKLTSLSKRFDWLS